MCVYMHGRACGLVGFNLGYLSVFRGGICSIKEIVGYSGIEVMCSSFRWLFGHQALSIDLQCKVNPSLQVLFATTSSSESIMKYSVSGPQNSHSLSTNYLGKQRYYVEKHISYCRY